MPRQLPWASKAGSARTQAKAPSRPAKRSSVVLDRDDEFFDGPILAGGSKKGKGRAVDPDDDLFDLALESFTPRTNLLRRGPRSINRAPSSSPPPIPGLGEPTIELMRKGVSKFDLRDDEWMMVEDEFLETAKLFTRHLHIAEYEKLKETIEAKKKEAEISRPVVPNAKLSFEGAIKERAKLQEKKQTEAILDDFASQNKDEDSFPTRARFSRPTHLPAASDSEGEDLDAIKPPPRRPVLPRKPTPAPAPMRHPMTGTQASNPITIAPPPFKKPAPPQSPAKPHTRPSRATPFDLLDAYTPPKTPPTPNPANPHSAHAKPPPNTSARVSFSRIPPAHRTPPRITPARAPGVNAAHATPKASDTTTGPRGAVERAPKRKAGRATQGADTQKRKTVMLDDIPTFLF